VTTDSAEAVVRNDPDEGRYELVLDGSIVGELDYRLSHDAVVLVHTEVDAALQGRGLGERLVAGALADIRARGLRPVAVCPFVREYLQRHPDPS